MFRINGANSDFFERVHCLNNKYATILQSWMKIMIVINSTQLHDAGRKGISLSFIQKEDSDHPTIS